MLFDLPFVALLALLLGFGFLIFVHELGHFLVAKWVGIRVTQFAIGFGPSMLTWRKGIGVRVGSTEAEFDKRIREHLQSKGLDADKLDARAADDSGLSVADRAARDLGMGETEYRLNYVPLGGYVKMLGQEDLDPAARSNDPRAYNSKSVGARAAVISAGVIMNLIFGVIFFIIAFMNGVQFPPAIVGGVRPASPAATTYAAGHEGEPAFRGLQVGDRIVEIDGDPVGDMLDVRVSTALGAADTPLEFLVRRPGVDAPLRYTLLSEPDPLEGLLTVGVAPPYSTRVTGVSDELAEAGVKPGMHIVAVQGQTVESYANFYRLLTTLGRGTAVPVTFAELDDQGQALQSVEVPMTAQPLLAQGVEGEPPHLLGLVPPTCIGFIAEASAAEEAGVQVGDLIASLDGHPWPVFTNVSKIVQAANARPMQLIVVRDGQQVNLGPLTPKNDQLGIGLEPATEEPVVGQTLPGSPAAALDLPGGSRIRSLAGQPVASWGDVQSILVNLQAAEAPVALPITYELPVGEGMEERATLSVGVEAIQSLQLAGWAPPAGLILDQLREPVKAENAWVATKLGLEKTGQFMAQTYITLLRLFQGSVKPEHLRGPVGIVDVGTQIAQQEGWQYLLFFLGLISVNLVVINFLPIPVVDGGHIVFLLIEKLKGSPPSAKVQVVATYIGLALIALVFVLVTYHDIARLV